MEAQKTPGGFLYHGQYRIEQIIGEGGQGVVYLARHTSLGTAVAIKELFDTEPETREHFLWQAQILVRLSHRALPKVSDFFHENGRDYLVMEYIDGDDLFERVTLQGPQDVKLVLNWANRVLEALHYLHKQPRPIIHRDIKPANLKLNPANEIYLVDFGLAKVGGIHHSTRLVAKGYTPGYSPPEQYDGRTDEQSDIYSLGATLYFLLSGEIPETPTERASGQGLTPLRTRNPDLPVDVTRWVEKAMAMDRTARWPNALGMAQAMPNPKNIKTKRPPRPKPSGPASEHIPPKRTPISLPVPPHVSTPVLTVAAAVLLVLLVGIGGLSLFSMFWGSGGELPKEISQEQTSPTAQIATISVSPTTALPPPPQLSPSVDKSSRSEEASRASATPVPPQATSTPREAATARASATPEETPIPTSTLVTQTTPTRPPPTATQFQPTTTPVPPTATRPLPTATLVPPPTSVPPSPTPEVQLASFATVSLRQPAPNDTTSDGLIRVSAVVEGLREGEQVVVLMGQSPDALNQVGFNNGRFAEGAWVADVSGPPGGFGNWYWSIGVVNVQGQIVARAAEARLLVWNQSSGPSPSSGGDPKDPIPPPDPTKEPLPPPS